MDKCVLDEAHPNYIGMYGGKLMNEQVRVFVEGIVVSIRRSTIVLPIFPRSI